MSNNKTDCVPSNATLAVDFVCENPHIVPFAVRNAWIEDEDRSSVPSPLPRADAHTLIARWAASCPMDVELLNGVLAESQSVLLRARAREGAARELRAEADRLEQSMDVSA